MAANPITEFDLGPLTWVKTEIDHSLNQARENLDKLAASPAERGPVKYILTHLHQATGALAMVGLGAATRFNEELEKLVSFLETEEAERVAACVAIAKKGIAALSGYLDMLLAGQADQPMRLLATYLELNRARGSSDAAEGDLFYPNLGAALPPGPPAAQLDDGVLAKALSLQRAQYQQGLLRILKGGDASEALRQMHGAIAAIESLQAGTSNRAFWTAATAFLDALVFGGLEMGPSARPIFAKLDQQVKQLMEGTGKVAERLFRDLLLVVARSRPVSERVMLLKQAYNLDALVAMPDRARAADDEGLAAIVRELRDLTAQQKDTWLKYTSGNRAALEPFGRQALALVERGSRLANRDVQLVLVRLTDVVPILKAKAIPPSEAQSLEVATALLFLESALENYFKLGADFSRQARTVAERLQGAMAGEALPPMEAIEGGLLDEMTRRAQEKLLIFQVGQEVQVNLQNIEQVLDGFFRDAARRGDLASLSSQFAQVQGALMIMELAEAATLNAAVMARVQQFLDGTADGSGEAAEMVADGLSALGLFINALQQGSSQARDALLPALLRFGLVSSTELPGEADARRTGTVSPLDIEVQKQKVHALYEDWKDTPAEETREKLERAVGELQRDAAVVSDAAIAQQSQVALQAIHDATTPDQTGVFNAIQGLAPEKKVEAPTAQVVQLVDAPGAEIDQELLEIFLEEATEVVETIGAELASVRGAPHDRDALTTIRRGFHTLKGSGRMVGLTDLGESAWQCEQVMNKWLKDEKPASAALLDFVGLAQATFGRWVEDLKAAAPVSVDAARIAAWAEQLKSDQPDALPVAPAQQAVEQAEPLVAPAEPEPVAAASVAPDLPLEAWIAEVPAPVADRATPAVEPLAFDLSFDAPQPAPVAAQAPAPVEFASLDLSLPADATAPEEAPLADAFTESADAFAEEADVVVGSVSVPAPLFAIYIGEAEMHAATMDREMAAIESDPLLPVSSDFMRAAHTLASSSRTTGFEAVAQVSAELEKWLAEAIDLPPEFDAHRLATTRAAVDALAAMVQSLRGHAMPYPREDVIAQLSALRDGLREARKTGQGTHIKMPGVVREVLEEMQQRAALQADDQPVEPPAAPSVDDAPAIDATFPIDAATTPADAPAIDDAPPAPIDAFVAPPVETPSVAAEVRAVEASEPVEDSSEPLQAAPAAPVQFEVAQPTPMEPVPHADTVPTSAFEAATVELPAAVPAFAAEAEPAVRDIAPEEAADLPFEAGKDQRRIHDDVDRDLLPIFLEEAKEILPAVAEGVRAWKAAPTDHAPASELQRHLHTLKGSARMTGLMRLGELAHMLETMLDAMDAVEAPAPKAFDDVEERVDRFSIALERLAKGEDMQDVEPIEVPVAAVLEHRKDKPAALAVIAAAAQERAEREATPPELREGRTALLRVNAELIDRFVNEAGELSIARSRIEGEMTAFKRALVDLTENIARMRTQLREIEIASEGQMQSTLKAKEDSGSGFDPLEFDRFTRMQELTRFLAESLGDVITLHQSLQKNLDETELAIHAQARLNRELQQGLMGVRLVPLGNLSDRFYRVVRQTAKELEKKANLEIKGTRTELDRSVLEKITGPFEHLLRNAIAHGIESPAERVAAGKPEIGEIAIDALQRGNEVVLTITDDGGGLNFAKIRRRAVEAGLLAPDVELPEPQLAQFIFLPGFSTADAVSQIAGRGVGMDVVRNEITSLGGRVEIGSTQGRGTTFTVTLPLTLAVTQAVMLRAGQTVYAVPSVMIEQVQEYRAQAYAEASAAGAITWKDNRYPLRSLLPLLGELDTPTPARQIPVLLLKSGFDRAAIRVDEIIGNREVVVKTIGPQISRLAGVAGATVLGNGQVVLILNPVQLVHREQPAMPSMPAPAREEPALVVEEKSGNPLVMVVDDSLTVRKITSRMLAREGYEVATAKDGVDALQQLQEIKPDCILLDVEMPRMDGFEFARNVRADAGTRAIPIIMITSRTADKHRNHALDLGVNEYMGKPYQEDQLLALIRRYTAENAVMA